MTELDKQLADRVIATGDTTPGNWNMVADVLQLAADYTAVWANRFDDARRIPDVLWEASKRLRVCAEEAAEERLQLAELPKTAEAERETIRRDIQMALLDKEFVKEFAEALMNTPLNLGTAEAARDD